MTIRKLGSILTGASKILTKLVCIYPGLYFRKRRAVNTFQSELKECGLDDEVIAALTDTYKDLGELKNWVPVRK